MGKFFQSINILIDLQYNWAKCGVDNKQLKCSRERKVSSVTALKQDLQKTAKRFTAIKNCIQDILTGISQ